MAPTDAGTIERSDSASSINKEKELISTQTRDTTHHHIADVEYVGKAGHAATDEYGNPIVEIDALVAKRVVRKFDLRLVPPLALLYLFCFIGEFRCECRAGTELTHISLLSHQTAPTSAMHA